MNNEEFIRRTNNVEEPAIPEYCKSCGRPIIKSSKGPDGEPDRFVGKRIEERLCYRCFYDGGREYNNLV